MSASAWSGAVLQAPSGLAPGARSHFVFVTDGQMIASASSAIADYDTFVTAQAGGATYEGQVVQWQVIGSTSTVNAIDHIGSASISGVYLTNGSLITTSTTASGLWSGGLLRLINQSIVPGNERREQAFTGTGPDGQADNPFGTSSVRGGSTTRTDTLWVRDALWPPTRQLPFYGISEVLSIPDPPPSPSPPL